MRVADMFESGDKVTRCEQVAVASGRAATRVGSLAMVLGRKGRLLLWPAVAGLTAIEQVAFGIDDLRRRLGKR